MEDYTKSNNSNENSTIKKNIVNYTDKKISAFSITIARKIKRCTYPNLLLSNLNKKKKKETKLITSMKSINRQEEFPLKMSI